MSTPSEERGESVEERPVGILARTWRWCKRNQLLATLLAGGAGFFVLSSLLLLRLYRDARAESFREAEETRNSQKEAQNLRTEAARSSDFSEYVGLLRLAERRWSNGNVAGASETLKQAHAKWKLWARDDESPPWEWGYLLGLVSAPERTLIGHTSAVTSVSFSSDGKRIVSGSKDETLKVWDAQTGQALLTLKGHTGRVSSVSFSPDGKRIASAGSYDWTLKVWDVQTGLGLLTLKGHKNAVSSVSFSPDGERIVSGTEYGTVKVWNAQTGQALLTLKGLTGKVDSVSFSPDGKRVVSGSNDDTVKLWDAQTGQNLLTLKGHMDKAGNSVSFSPDGSRIASKDFRGTAIVWETATGKQLDEPVPAVSDFRQTSSDGRLFALMDKNVVRVFDTRDANALQAKATRLKRMAQPDPAWHGEQAGNSIKSGNRFAAAFHLDRLTRIESQEPQAFFSRRETTFHVRLALGPPEAVSSTWADLANDPSARKPEKLWQVVFLGRFAPLTEADARRLVRMAEELVRKEKTANHLDLLGSALYRGGRCEEAARTLGEAVKLPNEGGIPDAKLFLALCCKQLGRDTEARQYYAEFAKWYGKQSFPTWQEQVRWQRLNEEARRLILTMPRAADD